MRLEEYYNKHIEGIEKTNESEWAIISDYICSYEMNKEDIDFLHSLDFNTEDFIDSDCTEEEFYTNNDLFLLIDYFYDVYGFLFPSGSREFSKDDLKNKLNVLNQGARTLSKIIEQYAD